MFCFVEAAPTQLPSEEKTSLESSSSVDSTNNGNGKKVAPTINLKLGNPGGLISKLGEILSQMRDLKLSDLPSMLLSKLNKNLLNSEDKSSSKKDNDRR